jgi:demethylmenaquinone methyltransferase/2-methoxy-6-polyprenyl-1,4-benzoquinol methylase
VTEEPDTGESRAVLVREMFDRIADRYDFLNRVLTFGMDVGWRRRAVRALALPPGSLVLDLACGTGDLCRELVRAGHRPVGFDFSPGMLTRARTSAALVRADVLRLPVRTGAAHGITCGFALRNVVDLSGLFRESARVLQAGGRAVFLEVSEPEQPLLRLGHSVYFRRVVPFVGGLLSDREAYAYLPASMTYLPNPSELARMLQQAGFGDVRRLALSAGIAQVVAGTRLRIGRRRRSTERGASAPDPSAPG